MNEDQNVNNNDDSNQTTTTPVPDIVQTIVNHAVGSQHTVAATPQQTSSTPRPPQVVQENNATSPPVSSNTPISSPPSYTSPPCSRQPTGSPSPQEMLEIYRTMNEFADTQSEVEMRPNHLRSSAGGLMPPSYSTVIRQGRPSLDIRRDSRSMEWQHISPFSTRVPPPTYAQIEGIFSREISSTSSAEQIEFGPDPLYVWCNHCNAIVITATHHERSKFTHFTAMALCLCGCWPCCVLPYCLSSCKNTHHFCPGCRQLLGTYSPW